MTIHKSVLLEEAIENLKLKSGDIVVDATLGGGGHSSEILKKIGPGGILIGIDSDVDAINRFKFPISDFQPCLSAGRFPNKSQIKNPKFKIQGNVCLVNDNFSNLDSILKELDIKKIDAILADFGISSDQLEAERGFSFQKDAPLDMRMDQAGEITAEKIVNDYSEEELARIFSEYGEEKFAKRIAKGIAKQRKTRKIGTTFELVSVIQSYVPERYKHQRIHFATRIFQALRIETNQELEKIREFIPKAIEVLNKGGRLGVIAFHSGEDGIAKEIFKVNARGCICPSNFPICRCGRNPVVKIITRKPILPGEDEMEANPRSRSAKLRLIEKL